MNRDLLKTVAGVVIVGAVIVATFLYGNHQSQLQQQKDQAARQTAQSTSQSSQAAKAPSAATESPTPAFQPQPSAIPQTGASTPLPQTGGTGALVPTGLLVLAASFYYHSRRGLKQTIPET